MIYAIYAHAEVRASTLHACGRAHAAPAEITLVGGALSFEVPFRHGNTEKRRRRARPRWPRRPGPRWHLCYLNPQPQRLGGARQLERNDRRRSIAHALHRGARSRDGALPVARPARTSRRLPDTNRVGRPNSSVPLAATAPPGETPLRSPLIVEAPEDGSQMAQ